MFMQYDKCIILKETNISDRVVFGIISITSNILPST